MNYFDRFAIELKTENRAIYLYGAGFIADKIVSLLKERNIDIDGYVVDERFLPKEKKCCQKDGKSIFTINEIDRDCVLVDAIQLNECQVVLPSNDFVKKVYRLDFSSYVLHGAYDEDFVMENIPAFAKLYDRLGDIESKISMANFIVQKVTGMYSKPKTQRIQYFDEDIFLPQENETFVDCGAYDGDSLLGFIDFLKKHNVSSYRKCFAFEPDEENYNKLVKNVSNFPDIKAFKIGTYCRKASLCFSDGKDTGSSIQSCGKTTIEVDTIDNIVNGEEVTYIKMDIEGAELDSLKGAKKTILKHRPKLAVCVYHKMDDLLTIANYLLSLHNDYKLYLRNYKMAGVETVLYAI